MWQMYSCISQGAGMNRPPTRHDEEPAVVHRPCGADRAAECKQGYSMLHSHSAIDAGLFSAAG